MLQITHVHVTTNPVHMMIAGSGCHRSPPHSSGLLSPCGVGEGFNASMPSSGCLSGLENEAPGEGLFPNVSSVLGGEPAVDDFLPDLLEDDDLEIINFAEMGINDAGTDVRLIYSLDLLTYLQLVA